MKKEMLTLIIGILIGAIIATGVFLVLKDDTSSSSEAGTMQEMGGGRGEMDGNMTFDGESPRDIENSSSSDSTTSNET